MYNFPGKNTGVGSYFLLQGIFLTEVKSPALQADSLCVSHQGSPTYIYMYMPPPVYIHILYIYIYIYTLYIYIYTHIYI